MDSPGPSGNGAPPRLRVPAGDLATRSERAGTPRDRTTSCCASKSNSATRPNTPDGKPSPSDSALPTRPTPTARSRLHARPRARPRARLCDHHRLRAPPGSMHQPLAPDAANRTRNRTRPPSPTGARVTKRRPRAEFDGLEHTICRHVLRPSNANAPSIRASSYEAGFRSGDGETRTRTGDATIFRQMLRTIERARKACKQVGFRVPPGGPGVAQLARGCSAD